MKRIISLLYISALFLGIVSCDNEDKKEVVTGPQVTTLEAVQGSILMATLSGRVSGVESVALDFQCGIECSTDESFSQDKTTRVKSPSKYSEEPYSIAIAVQPGKKYYYRAYYINQLLIYYGEIKTFSFSIIFTVFITKPMMSAAGSPLPETSPSMSSVLCLSIGRIEK